MGCLDDSTMYEFVNGGLAIDALATVDDHIDSCEECRLALVGLSQTEPPLPPSGLEVTELGDAPTSSGAAPQDGMHTLEVGQVLGEKYVVLDVLGSGAMGVVYAAWDSGLERQVAIKTLRADAGWKDRKERFLREAQAMAKVAHPNVVAVHEVGEVGELAFIAMEFVAGRTLREWVKQEDRDWVEVRNMCVQAGRGLAAAHEAGLVHRDFKPENVIVGDDGRARVTDFGLVALGGTATGAVGEPGDVLDLTITGAVMGTPAYMAPEQFKAEAVDARTDQYAFCATTWEALFGSRPFAAKSFDAQLKLVLEGKVPQAPSGVPRWLSQGLARGLAVETGARHATMESLLFDITQDQRVPPGRRIAVGVAVAGLGIAAAMFAGRGESEPKPMCEGAADAIVSVWSPEREHRLLAALEGTTGSAAKVLVGQLDTWRDAWVSAHTATCEATHVSGEQSQQLLDARMLCLQHRADETDALVRELETNESAELSVAVSALAQLPSIDRCANVDELSGRPVAPATVEALREPLVAARALFATGQYAAALTSLEPMVKRAEEVGYEPLVAEAKLLQARATWRAGRAEDASRVGMDALLAAVAGRADVEAAEAWISLVGMAGEQGNYLLAKERARHAQAAVLRLGTPADLQARLDHALGVLLYNTEEYEPALVALEKALEQRVTSLGPEHTLIASSHTSLGNVRRARGELAEALAHHKAALDMDLQILGGAHPSLGRHHHNIAGVLRLQRKLADARKHYLQALDIKTKALGSDHVDVALTNNSLGLVDLAEGNLEGAESYFAKAEAVLITAGHADRAVSAHNRGIVASGQDEHKIAIEHYYRAMVAYPAGSSHDNELARLMEDSQRMLKPGSKTKPAKSKAPRTGFEAPIEGVYAPTQTRE